MGEPVAKLDEDLANLFLWCVGCNELHVIPVKGQVMWGWNGKLDIPTLSPSLLLQGGSTDKLCHSFVRMGKWECLRDCNHAYSGEVVSMLPVHRWPAYA